MTVFIDTSCWVGFFLSRDQHHAAAVETLDRLAESGREFVTSDYVIAETVTYLRGKGSYRGAADAWDALEGGELVRLLEVDQSHRRKARAIMEKFKDHRFSLTDCVSFALMKEFSIGEAATFDEDFERAGFSILPSRE